MILACRHVAFRFVQVAKTAQCQLNVVPRREAGVLSLEGFHHRFTLKLSTHRTRMDTKL